MDVLSYLLASDFLPRGQCLLWRPDVVWLHVASDALIASAYFAIPVALLYFVRRRPDVSFGWLFWLMAAFLLLGGTLHALDIWTVWSGGYRVEGTVKLLTAGVSVATAVALWPILPKLLALPSPAEFEAASEELHAETHSRTAISEQLRFAREELSEDVTRRTRELENVNRELKREIVEREKAEERFRNAVESATSGMVMIDDGGRIVLMNRAAERVFGYARSELIGRPIEELVPEADREAHRREREGFMGVPAARTMGAGRELYGRRKDGTRIPVEIELNPFETSEGRFVLSTLFDITDEKRSQNLLDAKTRELERSNQALDEFAHVVSHDLKAPLRGITSLASWIAEDSLPALSAESRENLTLLGERAKRMSRMIDGILDYSRITHSSRAEKGVESRTVVEEVIDSLAPPDTLSIRIEGEMPVVSYDETQLAQVFQNLIGNAIEHHGKARGEVVVSCNTGPEFFEFAVRDDGVGIPERHHQRIFKIFQVLEPDPARSTDGIGLALVKRIVELHGGTVSVDSEPGTGTTFRFSIPRRRAGETSDPRRELPA